MDKKVSDKLKDGVSVKEIENFGRKFFLEIFLTLMFVLASFFALVFYGKGWSITLAGIGGIIGTWCPKKISHATTSTFRWIQKQQKVTRIVVAVICLVFSVFIPPLVFLVIGIVAGQCFHSHAMPSAPSTPQSPPQDTNHMG